MISESTSPKSEQKTLTFYRWVELVPNQRTPSANITGGSNLSLIAGSKPSPMAGASLSQRRTRQSTETRRLPGNMRLHSGALLNMMTSYVAFPNERSQDGEGRSDTSPCGHPSVISNSGSELLEYSWSRILQTKPTIAVDLPKLRRQRRWKKCPRHNRLPVV